MVTKDTKAGLLEKYRSLDFDDLCVLALAYDGHSFKQISMSLNLTPPAISHRRRKYQEIWGELFLPYKRNGQRTLTEDGKVICKKIKSILCFLMDLPEDFKVISLHN
jgi:DNA-binding transcriptional LysR family regulator